jgi:hypothetical protein
VMRAELSPTKNQVSSSDQHGLDSATSSDLQPSIGRTTNNKRDELSVSGHGRRCSTKKRDELSTSEHGRRRSATKKDELSVSAHHGRRRSTNRDEFSTGEHGRRRSATKKDELSVSAHGRRRATNRDEFPTSEHGRRRIATKKDELSVSAHGRRRATKMYDFSANGRADAESTNENGADDRRRRRDDLSRSEHYAPSNSRYQRPSSKVPARPQSRLSPKRDGRSTRGRSRDELAGSQHTPRISQESTSGIKRVSSSVTFSEDAESVGGTMKIVRSGPSISFGSMPRSPGGGLNTSRHRAPKNPTPSSFDGPDRECMMLRSRSSGDAGAMRRVRSSGATMDKPHNDIDNLLHKLRRDSKMSLLKANATWAEDLEDDPSTARVIKRVQSESGSLRSQPARTSSRYSS